jgi:hypothetical protein
MAWYIIKIKLSDIYWFLKLKSLIQFLLVLYAFVAFSQNQDILMDAVSNGLTQKMYRVIEFQVITNKYLYI